MHPFIPVVFLVGGAASLFLAARSYLKGPRCRWSGSCRVAVIGDSISAGGGYVTHLEQQLPRYTFDVYGGVGQGTDALLGALLSEILPRSYDEIIIQGGLNDIGRENAEEYILTNIERMVRAAKGNGARVILLSLTPWDESPQLIKEINKQLRWRSAFWGVDDYVNIWSPIADQSGGLRQDLIGDNMRVHPNNVGHQLIGSRILSDAY